LRGWWTTTEGGTGTGKFEIFRGQGGGYRFRLKASNGQIILTSESYTRKPSTISGIAFVKRNAAVHARFARKPSGGQFLFNLTATNGKVIGASERHKTERACENGVQSVMKHAPEAATVDLTVTKMDRCLCAVHLTNCTRTTEEKHRCKPNLRHWIRRCF
jgi:uncharacterized protein